MQIGQIKSTVNGTVAVGCALRLARPRWPTFNDLARGGLVSRCKARQQAFKFILGSGVDNASSSSGVARASRAQLLALLEPHQVQSNKYDDRVNNKNLGSIVHQQLYRAEALEHHGSISRVL